MIGFSLINGSEVSTEKFGHAEGTEFVFTKYLGHLFVRKEKLFVVLALQIVFLEVGPKMFHTLSTACL